MDRYYRNYHEAARYARQQATQLNRPMGIEKANEYGKVVYRIKMLPIKPSDRYGWELRCEVVQPGEPA